MKAKVVLLARIKVDGKDTWPRVQIKRGWPEPIDGAVYHLRYTPKGGKRVTRSVGSNIAAAYVAYQNEELNQSRVRNGLLSMGAPVKTNRVRIADAVRAFTDNLRLAVKTGEKSKSTNRSYSAAVEDFQKHCGVEYLDEVTGAILRTYKIYLFETIKKRIRGKKANTVANRFRFLSVFFAKQGIKIVKGRNGGSDDKGLMDWSDFPREERKQNIDKYSEEEIKAMLSVADIDEADLIQTFLRTGARDEEIAYLKWSDVDFRRKQIIISEKPEYGWRPKDKESRTIPLEDGVLLKRLDERRHRRPEGALVFSNSLGRPDTHLVKRLHKVVEKAQENGIEFEGDITLHKFRRTYASMMISHSDLQTVSALLGHSDIKTTSRYLAPDQTKARVGTRTAFNGVGE